MARDFSKMSPEELEAIFQANFGQGKQQQSPIQQTLSKFGVSGLGQERGPVSKALTAFGRGIQGKDVETDQSSDLNKVLMTEAIKSQFEDPTIRQLRQAEIDALGKEPPKGFVRVGKQTLADPDYINPIEQQKLDEAERVKTAEEESIRSTAEQNISSIQKAKEGSRFFGPLGKIPTISAPSSLFGEYGSRKEWENNINQLLSQKVVDLIAEMKRVSKTGATGFGQLSEKEGAILREASTALSRDLPPDRALYYLNEMEKINKKILNEGQSAPSNSQIMIDAQGNKAIVYSDGRIEEI